MRGTAGHAGDAGNADGRPPVERTMQLKQIKTKIEHDQYAVDAKAVAEAIVARLLAARQSECS